MKPRFRVVERVFRQTAVRWKWLRLLQHSATLGSIGCLAVLLLAAGILRGWMSDRNTVIAVTAIFSALIILAWLGIVLRLLAQNLDREHLAGEIESTNRKLLDRLNALIFLEKFKNQPKVQPFFSRIGQQAQSILSRGSMKSPVTAAPALVRLSIFAFLLILTVFICHRFTPWQRLVAAEDKPKDVRVEKQAKDESLPDPVALENSVVETNKLWGEVRITEPGRDLQVTKLDAVTLQVEAAANEPIRRVVWHSAINNGAEQIHELPPPVDSRYAAYKPVIEVETLGLSEWDVLAYFAKAETVSSNSYSSEVYFLEVRPFDEDLKKVPGAGSGRGGYNFLKRLTEVIRRQQLVIRETHRHVQNPPQTSDLKMQDREKLADAEMDVRESVKHLAGELAASAAQAQVSGIVDDLSQAQSTLLRAGGFLRFDAMSQAQRFEREALQQLIATRKHFQKVISENPAEFGDENDLAEDAPQKRETDSKDKLKDIAEFRNEAKAAQDFLKQAVQKQQDIAARATSASGRSDPKLPQDEKTLQQSLERFQDQHLEFTRGMDQPFKDAKDSLANAAEALQKRSRDAANRTQQGVEKLKELQQAVENRAAQQQLADAYKLKQMLDKAARSAGQCEQSPGSFSSSQLQQLANTAKGALDQLKNLAEQPPTRDSFGQPLRDALDDQKKNALDAQLNRLASAQGEEAKKQAAATAKEGLEKIQQAFNESLPQGLKAAKDPLKGDPSESLQHGLTQLEKFLQQLEKTGRPSDDQNKQGRDALVNLERSIKELYGGNERSPQFLARIEEELKKPDISEEVADLRKLLDELQKFSVEAAAKLAHKDEKPEVTNIDPARLPPAYRARIQKYFQRLSER